MKRSDLDQEPLEEELVTANDVKLLILKTCNLDDDVAVSEIGDDMPLFVEGVGLDQFDAIDIMFALRDEFGMKMPPILHEYATKLNAASKIAEWINSSKKKKKD